MRVRRNFRILGALQLLETWETQLQLLEFSPNSSQTGVLQTLPMSGGDPVSSGNLDVESSTYVGISQEDLIEDVKFYQDVAINYQNACEALLAQQAELQDKFKAQSHLIHEASATINAAENEAKT